MKLLKIGSAPTNNIVLRSPYVSSLHAELILLDNGDILLEDKNSRNGTFLMNQPVKPGTSVPVRMGDAIRFGDVELQWSQVPMPEDNSRFTALFGIGKNFRNEIQIEGNTVSRFHATLKKGRDGKWYIQDHSKNGTTVNGAKIRSGENVRIKRSDSVVCGGVPVNVKNFIPASVLPKMLASVGVAAVVVGVIFLLKDILIGGPKPGDLVPATTYVHGAYYVKAIIEDDPFQDSRFTEVFNTLGISWSNVYTIGQNRRTEKWAVLTESNKEAVEPVQYSGTAFFVSKDGKMGTNRHIAVPWEYLSKKDEADIRKVVEEIRQQIIPISQLVSITELNTLANQKNLVAQCLMLLWQQGGVTLTELNGYINAFRTSKITLSGDMQFMAVGYPNRNYNSVSEFERCTVLKESGDREKDVALLQLNNHKTPEDISYIYDMERARVNVADLKPQNEDLYTLGYPAGLFLNLSKNEDGGLKPFISKISVSKHPDTNTFEFQGETLGGASGSPIIDKKGRLVGVLYGRWSVGTTYGLGCHVKYLKELYDQTLTK